MTKLPIHLESLSKSELENMCVSCGICCRPAVTVAKGVNAVIPELKCKYLVKKANGEEGETCCSVYEQRFEKAQGWCLPLAEGIEKGIFPDLCPYVKDIPNYIGKSILDDKIYNLLRPQLKATIMEKGQPEWASSEDWKSFKGDDQ